MAVTPSAEEKSRLYELSLKQVSEIVREEDDPVALMASVVCVLKTNLPHGFWIGFYRVDLANPNELVIGPYQGTFGCIRIAIGQGVCGQCAARQETIIVPDVRQFPGHIACDSRSQSEIVVPVFDGQGGLYAVLDLDATEPKAFDRIDQQGLEAILDVIKVKL